MDDSALAACVSPDTRRYLWPLFTRQAADQPARATCLAVVPCSVQVARALNALWHSRLPYTQRGPWVAAHCAHYGGYVYAVALWNNPSARTLPQNWLELRRMAVAADAPHCTASFFLAAMSRIIARDMPDVARLISYQDTSVHRGTIYKAAGWSVGRVQCARVRDRTKPRAGTRRMYRTNSNGASVDSAEKVRWEQDLAAYRG
jgi:hypothetical protein